MKSHLKLLGALVMLAVIGIQSSAHAETFVIDTKGAHASINFRIKHLGFSWLTGRFDKFSGEFTYDEKAPEKASIKVEIDTASVNSNHAERDKHLRNADFLDVTKFPKATFESTSVEVGENQTAKVHGTLTLHGVTKDITIDAKYIGGGKDPWGGFRRGFAGTTKLALADFGINYNLGPASKEVELDLHVEGIRK
ncbi:MAG: YceI family protein [Filomicrobium sp.]